MATNFIRKLLGRRPNPSPAVTAALTDLARLAEHNPSLAALANELNDVLLALFAEPIGEAAPAISSEQAGARMAASVPLLRGEPIQLDLSAFKVRWQAVLAALQRRRPEAVAALTGALRPGKLDVAALTAALLEGRPDATHERAEALGVDVPLTATVLWLTLLPLLSHFRAALEPLLRSNSWNEGYCPCCGAWPKLGEFRGLEQTRFLRCGLCTAEWEFARLRCPYCGVTDHRQLGYLHVEGEEGKYRAGTCDACRQYLKMASTLTALTPPQLLVADLATIHLDLAATDQGYLTPG